MPDDGQRLYRNLLHNYNTLGCPLSKADRGPTKTLSSFIQDLQRSSLVNPPASPRAGTKPWLAPYLLFANFITSLPLLRHESFFGSFCRLNQHVWLWQHFLQLFSCSFEAVAFLPGQPYFRCGKWASVPNLTKMTAWPVLNLSSVASILSRSVE